MTIATWWCVHKSLDDKDASTFFLFMNVLTFYGLVEQGVTGMGVIWIADSINGKVSVNARALQIRCDTTFRLFQIISAHFNNNTNILFLVLCACGIGACIVTSKFTVDDLIFYIFYCIAFCFYIKKIPNLILLEACGKVDIVQYFRSIEIVFSYSVLIALLLISKSLIALSIWMSCRVFALYLLNKLFPISFNFSKNIEVDNNTQTLLSNFKRHKKRMMITNLTGFAIFNASIPYVYFLDNAKYSALFSQSYSFFNQVQVTLYSLISNNFRHYVIDKANDVGGFNRVFIRHNLFVSSIYLAVLLCVTIAYIYFDSIKNYLLPINELLVLGFAFLIFLVANGFMAYDRIKQRENFSIVGVVSAILTVFMYFTNYIFAYADPALIAIYALFIVAIIHLIYSSIVVLKYHES